MEANSGITTFISLLANCKTRHWTYPLLYSNTICNQTEPRYQNIMYWVGVYRQTLHFTSLDELDLTDFINIETYISKFEYLSPNNNHTGYCKQSTKLNFMCKSVDELSTTDYDSTVTTYVTSGFPDELTSSSTTVLSNDTSNDMTDTEEGRLGMIVGVTMSIIVVMVIIVVILVLIFRKIHTKNLNLNYYTIGNIPEVHYHDIDISNGDYDLPNYASDNIDKTKDDKVTYVGAISGVCDLLHEKDNRKNRTKIPNKHAWKLDGVKMKVFTLNSNLTIDQCGIDTINNQMSSDYLTVTATTDTNTLNKQLDNAGYLQLENVEKEESTKANSQCQITHGVDTDPTYDYPKNIIPRENQSSYDK
ncbi:uncharacterized protein LOC127732048 isoform X1 [Mytilus californianus]|uniref:uncharacterized protein LOC127732048 isoform X1 n=2 Tax=Mytilus californianus TaxID=6549 RepID=UPI0022479878|nr:uncharacterized protein LOC127732048 isoform X1 [Mytilus californianus]